MKTAKIEHNVDSILKVTKDVIQSSQKYNDYYIGQNDKFYNFQLPLLTSLNNSYSIENENSKEKEELVGIRNAHIRSNKIPKLCPLYNKKGDLLPRVASLAKISFRSMKLNNLNTLNDYLAKMPFKVGLRYRSLPKLDNAFNELQNDIFNGEYQNFEYNYEDIFGNREKYFQTIKDFVEKIKVEQKDYSTDNNFNMDKEYKFGKGRKKANLNLRSLKITFEDITPNNEKLNLNENQNENNNNYDIEVDIPFSLLPIFYHKGDEDFKSLLTSLIKFDENYEKVTLNYNELYSFLKNNEEFNKEKEKEKDKEKEKEKEKEEKLVKKPLMENELVIEPIDRLIPLENLNNAKNPNDFMTEPPQKINVKFEEEIKTEFIKKSFDIYPPIRKSSSFLNYNQFQFVWITPKKHYKVIISLPLITFTVEEFSVKIQQFIDFELLFYILEKDFSNWDFYIMKYISSFKKFRNLFENLTSINPSNYIQFYITNPKIKIYSFDNWFMNDIYTNDKLVNSILKFQSLYAVVTISNKDKYIEETHTIHFNFYQMIKFIKIKTYLNKVLFFVKFLNINHSENTVTYDYDILDEFNIENWVKDIKNLIGNEYFEESIEKNEKSNLEYDGHTQNIKIKIELKIPTVTLKTLYNGKENEINYFVIDDFQEELINLKKFIEWSPILPKCLMKDYEIILGVVPEIQQIKKNKKSKKSLVDDPNSLRDNNKEGSVVSKNDPSWLKKILQDKKSAEKLKDYIPSPVFKGIQFVLSEKKEEKNEKNDNNENNEKENKRNKVFEIFKGKKVKLKPKDLNLPVLSKMKTFLKTNEENNKETGNTENIFDVFKKKDNIRNSKEEINTLPFIK